MSLFRMLLPQRVQRYLEITQNRISRLEAMQPALQHLEESVASLETAIDVMLESPVYASGPDVGFNGQIGRKAIFNEVVAGLGVNLIVETGTWIGNTTGYMSEASGLRVISTELSRRFHSLARMRLDDRQDITLEHADSREFLRRLTADPAVRNLFPFIYLDAHWYQDLPLREEIEIIAQNWERFVIMIDDFEVQGDSGYGFDDFGQGRALSENYIEDLLARHDLTAFYPSLPSGSETGLRRGCVVLARRGPISDQLVKLRSLAPTARKRERESIKEALA